MGGQTNEADIAALMDVVRDYCEGMVAGDEKRLSRAFHPRACIVGNDQGELEWQTLEEFIHECQEAAQDAGPVVWQLEDLSIVGDTAAIRLGDQFAGEWFSDDLSLLRIDGTWCIVHKTWYVHPASAQPH
ncbi:nuclear transport factor 2 family protein [Oryzihumus leptocrescens]|uniref:Putative lumazine-binding protein n=1 Tax=Oryzihumus leptocrescens TaxID=297536 RepID=A0A542ZH16_9MICO|nr:nuclear transport factor 2 family protein [Oryzihumus leptocrescens]TQL59589.1 putative lumazine-binding protein [Oryzihumus leptocrescens]